MTDRIRVPHDRSTDTVIKDINLIICTEHKINGKHPHKIESLNIHKTKDIIRPHKIK